MATEEEIEALAEENDATVSKEEVTMKAPGRPATEEFISSAFEEDATPLTKAEEAAARAPEEATPLTEVDAPKNKDADQAASKVVEASIAPAAEEAARSAPVVKADGPLAEKEAASPAEEAATQVPEAATSLTEIAAPKEEEAKQTVSNVVEDSIAPAEEATLAPVAEADAPLAGKEAASSAEEAAAQVPEEAASLAEEVVMQVTEEGAAPLAEAVAPKFSAEPDVFLVRDVVPSAAEAAASPEDIEVTVSSTAQECISPSANETNAEPVVGVTTEEIDEEKAAEQKRNEKIDELIAMGFKPEESREALEKTSTLQEAAAFLVEKYHPPASFVDRIMGWFSAPKSDDSSSAVHTPGRYKVSGCRAAVRSSPESADVLEYLEDGTVVEIVELATASVEVVFSTVNQERHQQHVQGKMADGRWISIKSHGRTWAQQLSLTAQLVELGYTEAKAEEAAKRCSSIEAAVDYLS